MSKINNGRSSGRSSGRRFNKPVDDMISRIQVSQSYSVFLRKLESVASTNKFPYKSERRYGWRLARALYAHGTAAAGRRVGGVIAAQLLQLEEELEGGGSRSRS